MSEYMFGVSRVRVTRTTERKLERIARKHGATLVVCGNLPGTGYQRWFAGPNLGFPFDRDLSDAVFADIRAAKLTDIHGDPL